jgi:hypothetical protein
MISSVRKAGRRGCEVKGVFGEVYVDFGEYWI